MNNQNLPESRPQNIPAAATASPAGDDPRADIGRLARGRIADAPPGGTMLGLIDSLRALLIEAADRIEHWRGEIHCERDYLRKSKGRRVTLARVAKANARNKRMSAADRDRLTTLNRAAVAELDCWVPTARERIAECKRNIQTVEWTIRDLLAALVLVYQQAFSPRRAPEYKDLLAALEAGLPDSLLPKTPIAHLAANARRACARPATAARWPRTAEMLRFLSGPAGTIEPKIP